MRIAVLSDIHGNLPALRAVLADLDGWRPDRVIVNGDVVNRGPNSRECLEIICERMALQHWQVVAGNHEEFVLHCADNPAGGSVIDDQFRLFTDWTVAQLGDAVDRLRDWPDGLSFNGDDGLTAVVRHGSVLGSRDGIHDGMSDSDLDDRIPGNCHLFLTAHTHAAFSRRHGDRLIVNSGSVGSPFDGDNRACYARITGEGRRWHCQPVRVDYEIETARRNFVDSGFLAEAGPFAALFLAELMHARHLTREWSQTHEAAVRRGQQSADDAIGGFLGALGFDPPTRTGG